MAVFCGQCSNEYKTYTDELEHVCKVTGVTPTEPESMGWNWDLIQTSALDRGALQTTKLKLTSARAIIANRLTLNKSTLKQKFEADGKARIDKEKAIKNEI